MEGDGEFPNRSTTVGHGVGPGVGVSDGEFPAPGLVRLGWSLALRRRNRAPNVGCLERSAKRMGRMQNAPFFVENRFEEK